MRLPVQGSVLRAPGLLLGLCLCAALVSTPASAQDPPPKPRIMQEPGDVVDVIDAFDTGDIYDFQFTLQFQYLSKTARITRESAIYEPGLTTGGFTSKLLEVGKYIETTSRLTPRADFGIYKDFAFYVRVPIVLENARRIDPPDGAVSPEGTAGAIDPTTGAREQLFPLPFNSPSRSGVEYVALGLDLGIFNQARDRTKPTWLLGIEGRISAGEPMHACNDDPIPGQVACAHPGDLDRDGIFDQNENLDADGEPMESVEVEERSPGITRGTFGLEFHSLIAKRLKYIEPYGGITGLFEFQQGESDYGATDLEGALVNHPPIVGTVLVGMMIHPWEDRQSFGRLTFDLRFQGEYHSEGRDYSELFDALGSSSARSMRTPEWERYRANTECSGSRAEYPFCDPASVVDKGSGKTYSTGLAVVEPYGSYRASGSVTWRAGEYVKLNAGLGLRFDQAHGISHDQPCNPDFNGRNGEEGPCHSGDVSTGGFVATGIPNPAYRPAVNAIGRRFYVDESIVYEVFASGAVMF
jgi:hypothetical protein